MKKILYFSAGWCGPCKLLKPKIQALSAKLPIQIIDIDANPDLAAKYSIRNIPAVLVLNGDQVTSRLIGNTITEQTITESYNK